MKYLRKVNLKMIFFEKYVEKVSVFVKSGFVQYDSV